MPHYINYRKINLLIFIIALASLAVLFYTNGSYASMLVADNIHAIWPAPNNPAYCAQTYGSGWQSIGWDGYSNIQYCAHTLSFDNQSGISLVDNVQAIWPSRNSGASGGNTDCQISLGSDWQALGYDGNSNITFCKHFNTTSATPHNYIDGIKAVYPSTNSGTSECSNAFGSGWQTFGYNGAANTTYCKHFVSLSATTSTPLTPGNNTTTLLPNLAVQLPSGLTATAGTSFSINANLINNGQARAQINSWAQTAFSGPGLPSTGQISGFMVPPLEINASHNQVLYFTPPQAGTYYVGVCADVNRQVSEANENDADNCKTVSINVRANTVTTSNSNVRPQITDFRINNSYNATITSGDTVTFTTQNNGVTGANDAYFRCINNNGQVTVNLGGNEYCGLNQGNGSWVVPANINTTINTASAVLTLVNGVTTSKTFQIELALADSHGITQSPPYPSVTITVNPRTTTTTNNNTQTNTTSTSQPPTAITNVATGVTQTSAVLNATINPNGNPTTAWFEYGTSASLGNQTVTQSVGGSSSNINFSSSLASLQSNITYYFRTVAQNSYGTTRGSILSFTTSFQQNNNQQNGSVPSAITNIATGIGQNFVTFNGSANPNNASTDVWFEYGTSASLGNQTGSQTIGNSTSNINFSYSVSGLQDNTTYYFRTVAQNSYGTAKGNILSFTTSFQQNNNQQNGSAPIVYTNPPNGIGTTNTTLQGSANPNNLSTNAWFEYGTTPSLGLNTGSNSVGSGSSFVNFSRNVNNLLPNTVYYYRAVAENTSGLTYGNILNLNTGTSYSYYNYPNYSNYSYSYPGNGVGRLPIVSTRPASSIFQNVAILNGSAVPNNLSTSAWFEWGTNSSLTNSTLHQTLIGGYNSLDFSNYITTLTPGTTYYYQAVAENAQGQTRGMLLNFRTTGLTQVVYPTVNIPITPYRPVVATPSPQPSPQEVGTQKVALILTNDKKELKPGDIINLTAVYINEDDNPVHEASLKISFPEEVEYQNSSMMPVFVSPSQVNFTIGTLGAHGQGAMNIRAMIKSNAAPNNNLIWNFTLDYKDSSKNQHSVSNFIMIKISPLVAALGFAALLIALGGFWTLLLWLLIIALVLTSFYFFYRAIRKKTAV